MEVQFKKTKKAWKKLKAMKKPTVTKIVNKSVKTALNKNIELKYRDVNSVLSVDYTGYFYDLSTYITQGITDSTRVGDKLTMRSLELNYNITNGDTTNQVRVIVLRLKSLASSLTALTQILTNTSSVYAPLSTYLHDSRSQFVIHYDKLHTVDTYNPIKAFKTKIKMTSKTEYNGAGTDGYHHIFLLAISDSGAVTHPSLTWYTRMNYVDA